jgi:hypothetical protein
LLASAAVFAVAVLSVVYFGHLLPAPVGQASGSPVASVSSAPSASAVASTAPSVGPSGSPTFLAAGQLGYLELSGASLQPSKLSFINDATGASIDLGTVSGPPIAASLSPDGQWLAYITRKGETGANEVWLLHLTNGKTVALGCSQGAPFTDRLAWSADGSYLAFTLITVDLGPSSGCPADDGALGSADAWVYDAVNRERYRLTRSGNAYAASFMSGSNPATLLVSFAAESPWTEAVPLGGDPTNLDRIVGVFLPLLSPDGSRAIFWSGTMASSGGSWQFSRGGMPQLSGDFRAAGPASPWLGTPLFTDLTPVGGEAFASGSFRWGADSMRIAFWNGAWTGAPQSADGTYPSYSDLYLSTASALLSVVSRFAPGLTDQGTVMDVTYSPSGDVAITIGSPTAGIGDPPSATTTIFPTCCGGGSNRIGGGVNPPPWDGPAVFGH